MNRSFPSLLRAALACTLLLIAAAAPAQAQFWKKAKERVREEVAERTEKAEARAESKLDRAIENGADRTEALLENALRCSFGDAACVEEAEEEGRTVVLTDEDGNVLTDAKGNPVTAGAPLPPAPEHEERSPTITSREATAPAQGLPAFSQEAPLTYSSASMVDMEARARVVAEVPEDDAKERTLVAWAFNRAASNDELAKLAAPECFARRYHERRSPTPPESQGALSQLTLPSRGWIINHFTYEQPEKWMDCIDFERFVEATRRQVHELYLGQFVQYELEPLLECTRDVIAVRNRAYQRRRPLGRQSEEVDYTKRRAEACLNGEFEQLRLTTDGRALLREAQEKPLSGPDDERLYALREESARLAARVAHESAFRDEIAVYDAFVACYVNRYAQPRFERLKAAGAAGERLSEVHDATSREATQTCRRAHSWE